MFHDLDDAEALLNTIQVDRALPSAPIKPLGAKDASTEVMNFTAFSSGIVNGGGSKVLAVEVVGGEALLLSSSFLNDSSLPCLALPCLALPCLALPCCAWLLLLHSCSSCDTSSTKSTIFRFFPIRSSHAPSHLNIPCIFMSMSMSCSFYLVLRCAAMSNHATSRLI